MNEQQIALLAREALDEAAERLPWRVTHRLATVREAALARLPRAVAAAQAVPARAAARVLPAHAVLVSASGAGGRGAGDARPDRPPRFGWRLAAVVAPVLVVTVGLAGISLWTSWQRAVDIADVDEAVLTDDIPISAYADRGFGVFLKNVSQADRE